jgi:Zn-dependent metalloprotease
MLGLRDVDAEVTLVGERTDKLGDRHLTFDQSYRGVPVFAGLVRAHVSSDGRLVAVNGNVVPGIRVNPNPTRSASDAAAMAIDLVSGEKEGREVYARSGVLTVYRTGLAQGVDGESYLTWQIEVGNGSDIREFLFVDAHSGKLVDRLPGIMDAMFRRAYDGMFLPNVPPGYPGSPYWVEGDAFPTASAEANNMLTASQETYDFFDEAFGRDSFDGAGAIMDSIFNRGYSCPNASWNGTFISFCNGLTTDDVTAHEWGHAYTQYTHNLIYAWQPGALNESYSDIWGETVDRINNRDTIGNSATDPLRTGSSICTTYTQQPPVITINSPAGIAGAKLAGTAAFGPAVFNLTADVVVADDGVAPAAGQTLSDGCCAGPTFVCAPNSWTNAAAVAGKIALVDRGTCGFVVKAKNAQDNGAIGIIVANSTTGIVNMAGADPTVVIPSLSIGQADGAAIKAQAATVNATLTRVAGTGTDPSTRWLLGEDDTAVGLTGALRDMYAPPCYFNPGKVTDAFYGCGAADNGGVHNNSGVPNHAFALIVDGGSYNGQTITGIGLTKAAHIYFRAASVYQHSASNFIDHADAIEQSAADLMGVNLPDLTTGALSGEVITAADLTEIEEAMLAVEMRTPPTFCNFQPLLAQNPPALCTGTAGSPSQIFKDNFDTGEAWLDHWTVSHEGTTPDFTERDWSVVGDLPDGRAGRALFGPNPDIGTCAPGGDETSLLHVDSKQITIPNSVTNPRLTFMHWIATEAAFDGGNVKISVNGGPWTLIPAANFIYNAYNATLAAAPGNTNPIAGQPAFTGTDGGEVEGTWGRSIINLTGLATSKDKISLRFDFGQDGCTGRFGWYIDDLLVYKCN